MSAVLATVASDTTVDNFVAQAAEGKVKFHTERGNGTTRRIQFLAAGTAERETAEWVAEQREEGVTMKAIAATLHVSVPTVRRMINALLLTEEFEQAEAEDLEDLVSL